MNGCGQSVTAQVNIWLVTAAYLGWKPERYSFMRRLSSTSKSGGAHPSVSQTIDGVLKVKSPSGTLACSRFIPSEKTIARAVDLSKNSSDQRCWVSLAKAAYFVAVYLECDFYGGGASILGQLYKLV